MPTITQERLQIANRNDTEQATFDWPPGHNRVVLTWFCHGKPQAIQRVTPEEAYEWLDELLWQQGWS